MSFNKFEQQCKHHQQDVDKRCFCEMRRGKNNVCNSFECPLRISARKKLEKRLRRKATDEEFKIELKRLGLD